MCTPCSSSLVCGILEIRHSAHCRFLELCGRVWRSTGGAWPDPGGIYWHCRLLWLFYESELPVGGLSKHQSRTAFPIHFPGVGMENCRLVGAGSLDIDRLRNTLEPWIGI